MDGARSDHMETIRREVKQRAELGSTLSDIVVWLNSNGFHDDERHIGRLLAQTQVRRARRKRLVRLLELRDEIARRSD